jgi:hypothetical protein
MAREFLGLSLPPCLRAYVLLLRLQIDAPFEFEPAQCLACFSRSHRTKLAELDVAQRAIVGPVAAEASRAALVRRTRHAG